jgi:uncharacterized protein (TIGR02646 family)
MKHIQKQAEPKDFTSWKSRPRAYDRFKKTASIKKVVKDALMQEQGYLCCYCERSLTDDDSHIEHFQPRQKTATDPLDFNNLLCSCQKDLMPGEPRHCGNSKSNFDANLLISPFDSTCETRFMFTADGYIQAAQDTDAVAQKTLEVLQLDIPKLRALRRSAIAPFLEPDLSDAELQLFVKGYLEKSESGQYSEFWTTIRSLFAGVV